MTFLDGTETFGRPAMTFFDGMETFGRPTMALFDGTETFERGRTRLSEPRPATGNCLASSPDREATSINWARGSSRRLNKSRPPSEL